MATSEEHKKLTKLGASWFRKNGFGVVATELSSAGSREQPDVIAFRSSCSAMIEVKVSRSDFFADRKKPERNAGGIGIYRFYLCPEGMIKPEELPPRWGLLYAKGRSVVAVVKPQGNIWPPLEKQHPGSEAYLGPRREFQHVPDAIAERSALYSIARRLSSGTAA
ncbi:hypothetical protein NLO85_27695 [Pseudomonas savastanoi]|uniref:Uncharacterized protein n=2 Tax=Pseudomonas savastanoi TaxID=29438 RepID=A0A0P9W2J6_PSESS|nr:MULTISPECIES: hypothetical protein [Pseudomonas]KAA3532717.1 hypothetical protein DXU85_28665 [Pseudomonas savastanoi]KPX98732.1 hypothetical protein ALO61_200186 [Pseudomonas savastanoi pv. nerii]KPY74929.1 hypothetical protein ALO58_200034 [Pseudomonas savastanoi pv. savastanoi]KUG45767.1 hypothetical protein ALP79_200116 [Pseudomonas savastanoi pv. fraxini]KWS48732.1 hypothetical protein AL058_16160 [Pseudomonas savastanoi pv. nerii]